MHQIKGLNSSSVAAYAFACSLHEMSHKPRQENAISFTPIKESQTDAIHFTSCQGAQTPHTPERQN
jgi:hypothetical protein